MVSHASCVASLVLVVCALLSAPRVGGAEDAVSSSSASQMLPTGNARAALAPRDALDQTQSVRRPIELEDLLDLRDVIGSKMSPDGRWVAAVVKQADLAANSYRATLFLLPTDPGGRPLEIGSLGGLRRRSNG